ncbi:ankyrin [Apiospora aurea]|uniref:Ankyrin n=1 Tax=Apiospora aurea TaxID=335848 RepID=A0ABR1QKL0_9PEZI
MLKSIGLLDFRDNDRRRAEGLPVTMDIQISLIEALQKNNATWDEQYFNREGQPFRWWERGVEKVGRADILEAAVRAGGGKSTIQYLLGEGMQVHSRPNEVDGRSILHAALESTYNVSGERFEVIHMLLKRVAKVEADPVWPMLLGLSVSDRWSGMRLFHYIESLGATLPPPTDHLQANLRFNLIPKLLAARVDRETIQRVWGGGTGLDKLDQVDRRDIGEALIRLGNINWALTLIEDVNLDKEDYQDFLGATLHDQRCPLWFIRYLLQHGADGGRVRGNLRSPLHYAAERGNLSVAHLLMEYRADINAIWNSEKYRIQDDNGPLGCSWVDSCAGLQPEWTPLDAASLMGRLDMVKFLLHAGGRSGVPGHTRFDGALNLACNRCHGGVVMLLEGWIAGNRTCAMPR